MKRNYLDYYETKKLLQNMRKEIERDSSKSKEYKDGFSGALDELLRVFDYKKIRAELTEGEGQ